MAQYVSALNLDIAMLTLNGAAVYTSPGYGNKLIHHAPLQAEYTDYLLEYASDKKFALNFYSDGKLYSVKNERTLPWINLYIQQTSTPYNFIDSFSSLKGQTPLKMIFVGNQSEIDEQEIFFRELWGDSIYICRTWNHYLEFLNPDANKGKGIEMLAEAYNIKLEDVAVFGDASNDIPMFRKAGLSIAVQNAPKEVKAAAQRVSLWSNDEDAVSREWDLLKDQSPQN